MARWGPTATLEQRPDDLDWEACRSPPHAAQPVWQAAVRFCVRCPCARPPNRALPRTLLQAGLSFQAWCPARFLPNDFEDFGLVRYPCSSCTPLAMTP